MATRKTSVGVPWDGRTYYEKWVEDDLKLDLHRNYYADGLGKVPVKPWHERGISAVFYDIIGCESLAGMYVGEIAPGKASNPVRQLYDETIYIVSGHGSTVLETANRKHTFEFGPNSLFAIPLNCRYRLLNNSGQDPVRFISCNTIPVLMNLFRDPAFIHGCDWNFNRVADEGELSDADLYKPDPAKNRTAVDLYDTCFVPDITMVERSVFEARGGPDKTTVYFEMANSVISAHVADNPGLQFFNPHRHGPSAFVFTLKGSGYSIMWQDGGKELRWDWPKDDIGVIVPPNMWWHGHFTTSKRCMQLAVKLRSRKYPLNHLYDKTHKFVTEGGTVLRFKDLDEKLRTRIWQTYVEECAKNGFKVKDPNTA
jgi:cupin superfamily acireductone dioxygenase involved in methionine salvage